MWPSTTTCWSNGTRTAGNRCVWLCSTTSSGVTDACKPAATQGGIVITDPLSDRCTTYLIEAGAPLTDIDGRSARLQGGMCQQGDP
jgi:uncharacterized Zn-binding protein involved in type VI secretion